MYCWILFIGYLFQPGMSKKVKAIDGVEDQYVSRGFCILIFSVPLILIACRTGFGDTGSYLGYFKSMPIFFYDFARSVRSHEDCRLFWGIMTLIKIIINDHPQLLLAGLACFQAFAVEHVIRRYSPDLGLSMFIFLCSALLGNWMCNGIRQFTAVCILFMFTQWLVDKKWYCYLPLVLIVMGANPILKRFGMETDLWLLGGIHESAIIMLPIMFCLPGKPFNIRVFAATFIILTLIFTGLFEDVMSGAVENTSYTRDLENAAADTGTNIIRVLVAMVPSILSLLKWQYFKVNKIPPFISMCVNASFITAAVYLASSFTSGIYVGRLPIYTEIYNLILLPWLIKHAYRENEKLMRILLIAGYTGFFAYQYLVQWDGLYKSSILGIGV